MNLPIQLALFFFFVSVSASAESFSKQEINYLEQKGEVRYCIDPDWMPFESIDRRGRHMGASADLVTEFEKILDIDWVLVQTDSWSESMQQARKGECELLLLASESDERKAHFNFTEPYISLPVAVIGKRGTPYVDGMQQLLDKTVSLVEGYVLVEFIQRKYPEVELIYQNSLLESLRAVASEQADVTLATLPTALYQIQKNGMTQLEIAGYTEFSFNLSIAVNNQHPMLSSIMNKLVMQLQPTFVDRVLQRWYTVEIKQATDYKLLVVSVAVLSLLVAMLLYRNRLSYRFNCQLEKVNARLTDRNQRLEQLSQHDFLTGSLNRPELDKALEVGVERSLLKDEPLNAILLDVDNFCQVNVRYGHAIGDLVLVELSHIIEEVLPDWAVFGRWGGDCFLVVCPKTSIRDSHNLAQRLQTAIGNHHFHDDLSLTASFCSAGYIERESAAEFMRRVETALAQAQPAGAQQLIFLEADEPPV